MASHVLADRLHGLEASPTLALAAKAKALAKAGKPIVDLTAGEPDFPTPEPIKQAAIQALRQGKTKYTPVGGIPELKDAIREKLKRDNGLDYSREEILVSVGGKHALYNACAALLDPGDEVIIPAPYWVSYPDQVLLNDARPVVLQTREEDGFLVDPEALEKAITRRTKMIILKLKLHRLSKRIKSQIAD